MRTIIKRADDLAVDFDFTDEMEGDAIARVELPMVSGVEAAPALEGAVVTVTLSGGVVGVPGIVTVRVLTQGARVLDKSVKVALRR